MTSELFVAPFPRSMTPEEIQALFEQVGPVKGVKRPRDQETGDYRKFAFVTMGSPELAAAAVEKMNGVQVSGMALTVKLSEKPAPAKPAEAKTKPAAPAAQARLAEFVWEQRLSALERVLAAPGTASTVKITVVGRPAWVEPRDNLVMLGLTHSLKPSGYPKGVPTPPDTPTLYVVYIGAKQWKKVAEAIQNPEDVLIIEGQPLLDAALSDVAVFATNVNTKLLQQASKAKPEEASS